MEHSTIKIVVSVGAVLFVVWAGYAVYSGFKAVAQPATNVDDLMTALSK